MSNYILGSEADRKNVSEAQNTYYASALKQLIDCRTVWTPNNKYKDEYQKFYDTIAVLFPTLHKKAKRLTFGNGCFFYILENPNAKRNILLMSHHDVVDGSECWETDPFCAVEKDGALWGRGSVDTKTPLFAELQAVEELLLEGYIFPDINLYIGSSHNEEVGGDGMVLAVEYFKKEDIFFEAILDEGGAITTGMLPGVSAKSAVIAVHEKSRHLYRCTVKSKEKGHGGLIPSKDNPLVQLSTFISRVNSSKIFRPAFAPEVKATFTKHVPYMKFPLNIVFGNFNLFSTLIKKIMVGIPQAAAMISTGVTFTTFRAGDETLPQIKAKEACAHMMLRCVREEDLQKELLQIEKIAKECDVELELILRDYCQPTSFNDRPFQIAESVLHKNFPDVIVAPFLLTAGTDARRFTDIAGSILRFAPIDLNKQQFASIHGDNENITIKNIGQCVLFYKDFMKEIN